MESIIPDGVIPFKIDKKDVEAIFTKWIKRRWLAPNVLKTLYQKDKVQGIYMPYWTFDADTSTDYTAMGGIDYQVEYKDDKGEVHTRIETKWYPTRGHINHFFDDVLVRASNKLSDTLLGWIEPYNTKEVASYSPFKLVSKNYKPSKNEISVMIGHGIANFKPYIVGFYGGFATISKTTQSGIYIAYSSKFGESNTCNGDSGGPLAVYEDGSWRLFGTTSYGDDDYCGYYAKAENSWWSRINSKENIEFFYRNYDDMSYVDKEFNINISLGTNAYLAEKKLNAILKAIEKINKKYGKGGK